MADELKHVGVLGMKWGRRKSRSASTTPSSDHTTARSLQKKKLSEMSNEDLKKLTSRLQLEKQYKDLNKRELGFGSKFLMDVVSSVAKQNAISWTNLALKNGGTLVKELIENRNKG